MLCNTGEPALIMMLCCLVRPNIIPPPSQSSTAMASRVSRYQESTEHVEADEVDDGEAAAAGSLLAGVVV